MVVTATTAPANDVVFLVEATTNLESSFSEIKSSYISQILNYFSPSFGDDAEMIVDVSVLFLNVQVYAVVQLYV